MRITELSLSNFRSFSKEQSIKFAPVTLLFGPNSVGKSTLLMALFYVQQILAKGQCDPQRLEAMGDRFVGGFKTLVHGKDPDRAIKIRIEFEKGDRIGSDYREIADFVSNDLETHFLLPDGVASEARSMAVELEIAWSAARHTAYIACYKVSFDGQDLAEVTSDPGLKQPMVTGINYLHPLLIAADHEEWLKETLEAGEPFHSGNTDFAQKLCIENTESADVSVDYSNSAVASYFHSVLDGAGGFSTVTSTTFSFCRIGGHEFKHAPLGIDGFAGALPHLGKRLRINLSTDDDKLEVVLKEILSDLLVAPLDNLLEMLNDSLCIGPLREISDDTYQSNAYPKQGDWYSGKACWDELANIDVLRDTMINHWLAGKEQLNLGYKLVYKIGQGSSRFVLPSTEFSTFNDAIALSDALGDKIKITFSSDNLDENPDAEQTEISPEILEKFRESGRSESSLYLGEFPFKNATISLWDCQNNIEVTAADIGVGVSQLLPLIVAATIVENGLIACEQPELHIHPRVQVGIGDMLLQATKDTNFLIETHSEHLVLRLLRRIRESSGKSLPQGMPTISPSHVSIVYLEPSDDGVQVKHLEITEDGDFEQSWPGGFFDERDEELF